MGKIRWTVIFAWIFTFVFLIYTIDGIIRVFQNTGPDNSLLLLMNDLINAMLPLVFGVPAVLIVYRHPRQMIGWSLMIGPIATIYVTTVNPYLSSFQTAPPATIPMLLATWISSIIFILIIIPLLTIPMVFPTGRPPSPRWNWFLTLTAIIWLASMLSMGLFQTLEPDGQAWKIRNPLGIIPDSQKDFFIFLITCWLMIMAVADLVSIIIRYRRASTVERTQLKWLLFPCAILALNMVPIILTGGSGDLGSRMLEDIIVVSFSVAVTLIPVTIAIAILRYRLFDIDIIIRQTLVYTLVTGTLGLLYFGGIVLLQGMFRSITGQTSNLAVVITTLIIAVMFNPVRRRIQFTIDRRFYRQKYNAEQALAEFSKAAINSPDLDSITSMLKQVTRKTLQPAHFSLYLKPVNPGKDSAENPTGRSELPTY